MNTVSSDQLLTVLLTPWQSGVSLMTGFYDLHVYEDALRSENGVLTVDLLNGKVIKGKPSSDLAAVLLCLP